LVGQCKNGHVVCDPCRVRIHGTCPSCRNPVGEIRCRALEKAIADMVLPCAFSRHGCTQLLKHKERQDHEALCHYAPFVCPFQGCAYSVESTLLLHDHILDTHAINNVVSLVGSTQVVLHWSTPFEVLLDPVDRCVFLLLNGGDVPSGRSLSVVCLGPRPMANQLLEYKLKVGGAGEPGALSLSASGSVPCMRRWAGQHPNDGFLFVPNAYWTSFSCVLVNVRVQKSAVDSLVRCFKHASLETFNLLVLVFVCLAMALVLAWKTIYR
ncbi:putative E3 ubiquitin-protein ligase SINA-like 6, partial [Sorghum bicolor]|uniref:putative E3 ubiquitin-protein ligase SINA-like 6 n=1 Tax=Sorghum bicolor TaxID=4558 RepID=UPI000B424E1A